ncbi:hypothetical protein ACFLYU_04735 [Candidatus Dependentiae bacterium]
MNRIQKTSSSQKEILHKFFSISIATLLLVSLYTSSPIYSNSCSSCTPCSTCCDYSLGICDGYPYFQIRSQGKDLARELVGRQEFVNRYDIDESYGAFSFAVEYTRAFKRERLTHFLFGNDLVNCCQLYIQGSSIENRHSKAWLADYFGLPTDFDSRVSFYPNIQNVILDLNFYIGLDELTPGLFCKVNTPLVWSKWELNPCEKIISRGELDFDAGYMSQDAITRASLANSFLQIMAGGYIFGDMKVPMKFGKISNCGNTKTAIAQIDLTLGYNFLLREDRHFGVLFYGSVPTGTRPKATYLFEPMIGNGKHWELGFGFTGSWIFWCSEEDKNRYMGLWLESTLAHLFKTCQCRSFDFCGKPNSRYMLLEEMTKGDGNLTGPAPEYEAANYQYAKNLIPAINWSTFNIKTRIDIQGEIAIKLGCVRDNWSLDIGYNLWGRTGEKFYCGTCNCNSNKLYAIKGDSDVYGQFIVTTTTTIVPLSKTQSLATIHTAATEDNSQLAFYTDNGNHRAITPMGGGDQVTTSIQPVLVKRTDLYLCKSPSSITHKLFGHLGYAWKESNLKSIPFVGIGGNIEFAQDKYKTCCCLNKNCNCCNLDNPYYTRSKNNCKKSPRAGLSQWGVWAKGGVSFD